MCHKILPHYLGVMFRWNKTYEKHFHRTFLHFEIEHLLWNGDTISYIQFILVNLNYWLQYYTKLNIDNNKTKNSLWHHTTSISFLVHDAQNKLIPRFWKYCMLGIPKTRIKYSTWNKKRFYMLFSLSSLIITSNQLLTINLKSRQKI